ncbi:MAG: four helix bundle protein [Betaproteobacteria bacterium]|nr:four helix bundle protein [Betaproteobacteria bacterium]
MARYDHLPIWKDAMALTTLLEEAVRRFPRYHKYALGTDLRRQAYAVCRAVVAANAAAETRGLALERLALAIEELKLLIQLGKEVRAFASFKVFEQAAEIVVALGRQCAGWRRAHGGGPASSSTPGSGASQGGGPGSGAASALAGARPRAGAKGCSQGGWCQAAALGAALAAARPAGAFPKRMPPCAYTTVHSGHPRTGNARQGGVGVEANRLGYRKAVRALEWAGAAQRQGAAVQALGKHLGQECLLLRSERGQRVDRQFQQWQP